MAIVADGRLNHRFRLRWEHGGKLLQETYDSLRNPRENQEYRGVRPR